MVKLSKNIQMQEKSTIKSTGKESLKHKETRQKVSVKVVKRYTRASPSEANTKAAEQREGGGEEHLKTKQKNRRIYKERKGKGERERERERKTESYEHRPWNSTTRNEVNKIHTSEGTRTTGSRKWDDIESNKKEKEREGTKRKRDARSRCVFWSHICKVPGSQPLYSFLSAKRTLPYCPGISVA